MIISLIRKLSFIGILTFLVLFFYFYKTSGKFRQSIIAAFAAVIFYSSAHSTGEADGAFTQQNQQHQSRPQHDPGIFGRKSNNDRQVILAKAEGNPITPPTNRGPSDFPTPPSRGRSSRPVYVPKYRVTPKIIDQGLGAGANPAGAGGGENPEFDDQCPVPKKQQSQESKTFDYDYDYRSKKKKQSAEQCELEEEFKKDKKYGGFAYKLDKSGNPILRVETKAGSEILLTYDKALEKYYHQDVYNLETPKNFDSKKARSLKLKDRIKYLKETVPPNKVIEFQIANAKSLSTENLTTVPGFISARKEPGTLYINEETGQVHFVNARTNIWRTTVIKTRTGLINLAQNDFHLFPDAGK